MLNELQIKEVSQGLSNWTYEGNLEATNSLIELFDMLTKDSWLKTYISKPTTIEDYIRIYDGNFYTYQTFEELVKSEEEQNEGFTREECLEQIGNTIWQLPCGWYVQYV